MKKAVYLICILLIAAITVSSVSCSSNKSSNLEVFVFLLNQPTIEEVNEKIGDFSKFESKFSKEMKYGGNYYNKRYTYKLKVCGMGSELTGITGGLSDKAKTEDKPRSWVWGLDIPENKADSFLDKVTNYFNAELGNYSLTTKMDATAYKWTNESGSASIYLVLYDSDTFGLIVEID